MSSRRPPIALPMSSAQPATTAASKWGYSRLTQRCAASTAIGINRIFQNVELSASPEVPHTQSFFSPINKLEILGLTALEN
jgi:hypothetical protein